MKLHKIALAVFLGAASMAASAADNPTSQSADAPGSAFSANNTTTKSTADSLRILQPKLGATVSGTTTVKAVLKVGDGIPPKSFRILLNGKNVTRHAQQQKCQVNACEWTVELTKADRLLSGQNQLVAFARGSDNSIKLARTKFGYYYGLSAGQNLPNYLPSTVGLSLNPGGAQPWITMTTGTPANLQDNLDPTQYSLPYRDTTFPTTNDMACTERYQVVVLNRHTPAVEDAYFCASDSATLKSDLAGLTKGTEIVLVGTTLYNNADAGLDTTSIGGTNYSNSNGWQPMGYAAIGVSGAAPGSAYESYYVASDVGKAYQTNPFANGLLAVDQYGNYNFHAGNNLQFQVYPNNPSTGTSNVFISYNGNVHGWNPPPGSNGIWVLVLDRVTLLPIDASTADGSPCQPWGPASAQTCGTFYPTGSTDSSVAPQAAINLFEALKVATSRQLVVLTTVGQPFQSASVAATLVGMMGWYGGSGYTLESLTTPTSTFTLVAPGPETSPVFSLAPFKSPFATGVVNSSSAFSQQGQTGIVRGVMARDNNSLYFPSVVSQEDGKGNAQDATSVSIDYDFYTISTQAPGDWPLTDTSGHIAAYHYASKVFLSNHNGETGSHSQDLRFFYAGNPEYGQYNTDFQCTSNPPSTSPCVYPGDGLGFTEQDLADANAQLYSELTALNDTNNYLGNPGIGGVIQSDGSGGMSDEVIGATYEVLNGQVGAVPSTSVSASSFDWMNLLAGVTSIAAAALGPVDLPIVAASVGVTSGVLWTGSALDPWWQGADSDTPPSYENTFDTTLGDLQNNAIDYAENLANSYGTGLDNIYTDWGKLQATGAKTADSNSGWSFSSALTRNNVADQLAAGVRRSMYLQLVPKFYSQDTYTQQPITDIDKLGMFWTYTSDDYSWVNKCTASYPSSLSSLGYAIYPTPGAAGETDIYVMGGTINNQGGQNVSESLPSDLLLSTLFSAGDSSPTGPLNIPQDLMYGSFTLPARQGPLMDLTDGIFQCYKPGCSDTTGNPKYSSCIAP